MIRPARPDDAPAIRSLQRLSIRALAAGHYSAQQIDSWCGDRSPDDYLAPIRERIVYVAEDGGRLLGFSQLDPASGEVQAVYVHPRQSRRGLGRALLHALEAVAGDLGLPPLHLDASLNAVAFYAAAGYEAGAPGLHALGPGIFLPCRPMRQRAAAGGSAGVQATAADAQDVPSASIHDSHRGFST